MPLLTKDHSTIPDLVIKNLLASSDAVTVVVTNQGNAAVADAFWVDAYVNPTTPPTGVNQRWEDLGTQGVAWGVVVPALPLAPSQVLTLTLGGNYYFGPPVSNISLPLPAGSVVYAQVDSVNFATTYGNVAEGNEANNISGPVFSTNK